MLRSQFALAAASFLATPAAANVPEAVASVERRAQARVGLTVLRADGRLIIGYRAQERFPLASTQKLALVMAVLARRDLPLTRVIRVTKSDLESPDTSALARRNPDGVLLPLAELCRLTISQSDNTAADVLMRLIGGPPAVTAYLRGLGVTDVRIDRTERQLPNSANGREPRDTGTPAAMARLTWRLAYDSPLPVPATQRLLTWMRATTTGGGRIRAGVPAGWQVADKTGSYHNAANDIGLIYPPHASPVAIACYVFGVGSTDDGSRVIESVVRAIRPLL